MYIRVARHLAGYGWPQAGHYIEIDDCRCSADEDHDYVSAENSHNAFIYADWIRARGVPADALAVVRLTAPRPRW